MKELTIEEPPPAGGWGVFTGPSPIGTCRGSVPVRFLFEELQYGPERKWYFIRI